MFDEHDGAVIMGGIAGLMAGLLQMVISGLLLLAKAIVLWLPYICGAGIALMLLSATPLHAMYETVPVIAIIVVMGLVEAGILAARRFLPIRKEFTIGISGIGIGLIGGAFMNGAEMTGMGCLAATLLFWGVYAILLWTNLRKTREHQDEGYGEELMDHPACAAARKVLLAAAVYMAVTVPMEAIWLPYLQNIGAFGYPFLYDLYLTTKVVVVAGYLVMAVFLPLLAGLKENAESI